MFAAINSINEDNDLLKPKIEINRKLIELMLQGCIMDLKETGKLSNNQTIIHDVIVVTLLMHGTVIGIFILFSSQTNTNTTGNAIQLIKHVYSFLCMDEGDECDKFNERVRI